MKEPAHVDIMGVRIHAFTLDLLHECIGDVVRTRRKAIIANVNINAMNLAWEMTWFRDFLNESEYVFCDGHGVMLAARLIGQRLPQKITYAPWLSLLASFCADRGISLFLLGGAPGVADQAAESLRAIAPALSIKGTHHGFFDKQKDSAQNRSVIEEINRVSPDILLTSFGMPLQEKWLAENWRSVDARVALTGGAALDYAAGTALRPPAWLTDHGFEWLGRMIYEPRRLWRRYLIGNPLFFMRLLRSRITSRAPKAPAADGAL